MAHTEGPGGAAFEADPLWSWASPHKGFAELWRLFVSSALRYLPEPSRHPPRPSRQGLGMALLSY